jgi:hypothetical protein
MIGLIDDNRTAIEALCREYHVATLEVFGSASVGAFDPKRSDVDLLVEFHRSDETDAADQYFGLLEALESLLGRHVDLVCARAIRNPYFMKGVNQSRRLLYAA